MSIAFLSHVQTCLDYDRQESDHAPLAAAMTLPVTSISETPACTGETLTKCHWGFDQRTAYCDAPQAGLSHDLSETASRACAEGNVTYIVHAIHEVITAAQSSAMHAKCAGKRVHSGGAQHSLSMMQSAWL